MSQNVMGACDVVSYCLGKSENTGAFWSFAMLVTIMIYMHFQICLLSYSGISKQITISMIQQVILRLWFRWFNWWFWYHDLDDTTGDFDIMISMIQQVILISWSRWYNRWYWYHDLDDTEKQRNYFAFYSYCM